MGTENDDHSGGYPGIAELHSAGPHSKRELLADEGAWRMRFEPSATRRSQVLLNWGNDLGLAGRVGVAGGVCAATS